MRRVQAGPVVGFVSVLALLGLLAIAVGLGGAGWATGVACGMFVNGALARGLAHHGSDGLGPAGRVTLTRAVLVCGVAALTADSFSRSTPVAVLVALTVVALALDAVDGKVARRTGTVSALGARFDMEIDAFLILVLSVYVAPTVGWWVLAIGLARYALLLAERMLPWLNRPVPPRHWRKWVAAIQGIVLGVAAADVLPDLLSELALVVALALLAESFGRDVWWLWRQRNTAELPVVADRWPGARVVLGRMATVGACLTVWFVLVAPNEVDQLTPEAFVRIPLEGLLLLALGLVLPPLARRVFAVAIGLVLGLLVVVKVLDMGFNEVMDRPFDPVNDWGYLGPGYGVLGDSIGSTGALVTAVVLALLVVGVLVLMPAAVGRLTRLSERHRVRTLRAVAVLGVAWAVCAVSGLQVEPGADVASTTALNLAVSEVDQVRDGIQDRETFAKEIADDDFRDVPGNRLLTGLRGKDVLLVFVESYGRVAVQDSDFSPEIQAVLDNGTDRLRAAGFNSRSAFPDLTDVRRGQLAGALLDAVGPVGQQPAAVQPARPGRPDHPHQRLPTGRLADRVRRTRDHARLAGGRGVLRLRQALRLHEHPVRRPQVRLRQPARPVHPRHLPPARAGARRPEAGDGRARPGVQPPSLGTAPPDGRLARARRRLGLQRDAGGGRVRGGGVPRLRRRPQRVRRVDRVHAEQPDLVRGDQPATRTWCSSCSATTSRTPTSPATTSTTTSRSPSSPTTRPSWTGSPAGAGTTASTPPPTPPSGPWTPSATASSPPTARPGTAG